MDLVKEGETYTDDHKIYYVSKIHGGRCVLLPKGIASGVELPPIVLGKNDFNFFKKLKELDTSDAEGGLKKVRIALVKDKITNTTNRLEVANDNIARIEEERLDLLKNLEELKAELKELTTPTSIKFIKGELDV